MIASFSIDHFRYFLSEMKREVFGSILNLVALLDNQCKILLNIFRLSFRRNGKITDSQFCVFLSYFKNTCSFYQILIKNIF